MKLDFKPIPTILLVEDDEDDCIFFQEAMTEVSAGIALKCLNNTGKLMEVIESTKPCLIFVDFKLPGENGLEGVRRLKTHPVFNSIPIIMWSTSSIVRNVKAAYEAGVQLYMEKPWSLKVLVEKLKKILKHNRIGLPTISAFISSKAQNTQLHHRDRGIGWFFAFG